MFFYQITAVFFLQTVLLSSRHNRQACPIICCMNCIECLPPAAEKVLHGLENIREIRLRNGKGIKVNIGGVWFWVGHNALLTAPTNALRFEDVCDSYVKKACNQSVYAYEKMLAKGFFTLGDGARVGVCGVQAEDGIFQRYTSLCIRTANFVHCCVEDFCQSVVVAGPPRSGKTTYLRDLACKLSQRCEVVIVDERGEISSCGGFEKRSNCDVFKYASKRYAFEVAVRSMSPDWIVCDELSEYDLPLLPLACASGVRVAASVHAADLSSLKARLGRHLDNFHSAVLLQKDTFQKTVVTLPPPVTQPNFPPKTEIQ